MCPDAEAGFWAAEPVRLVVSSLRASAVICNLQAKVITHLMSSEDSTGPIEVPYVRLILLLKLCCVSVLFLFSSLTNTSFSVRNQLT